MWQTTPDDIRITEMDPVQKMWFYNQWLGDQRDQIEVAKNHAYLLGSFINPEAVQKMLNTNVHESSDEDFEESLKIAKEGNEISLDGNIILPQLPPEPQKKHKRKKARLVQDNK
jgi:hypothetical protein